MRPTRLIEALIDVRLVCLEDVLAFGRATEEGEDRVHEKRRGNCGSEPHRLGARSVKQRDGGRAPKHGAPGVPHEDLRWGPVPQEKREERGYEQPPHRLVEIEREEAELHRAAAADDAVDPVHEVVEVDQRRDREHADGGAEPGMGRITQERLECWKWPEPVHRQPRRAELNGVARACGDPARIVCGAHEP